MKTNSILLLVFLLAILFFSPFLNDKKTNVIEKTKVVYKQEQPFRIQQSYTQVGILSPLNGRETNNILPLMGLSVCNRRDLWNYYAVSNQHNNVRLPISVKGKSATNERGVDKIYSGDAVYVEGANETYKATVYDTDTIRYMPM
jgi:hypothetical protein